MASKILGLLDLLNRNIEDLGECTRLVFGDRRYTNVELRDWVCRFAGGLRRLGLGPGDRIVTLLPNGPEAFISLPASLLAGAALAPLDWTLTPFEIGLILRDFRPSAIVADAEVAARVEAAVQGVDALERIPRILAAAPPGDAREGWTALESLCSGEPADIASAPLAGDDLALVIYTSGTTGEPKGVMLTQGNLLSQIPYRIRQGLAEGLSLKDLSRIFGRNPATLIAVPLCHAYAITMVNIAYLAPIRIVLFRRFDPEAALAAIQEHGVRFFGGVPTMYVRLLALPEETTRRYDLSSVLLWISGAAGLPSGVAERFESRFGVRIYEGYGLSEASAGVTIQLPTTPYKPGSIGIPMPGLGVRILDEQGRDLARGEVGELAIQGANVMKGYWGKPEATAEALKDGWLHTGDMARWDEDGHLFIVDRKKDLIIRGGRNVYPREVEEAVAAHPAVADVAVVGIPDAEWGEQVRAFVVLKGGAEASEAEILEHAKGRLAPYKCPRAVTFLKDLPRNGIGKVLKRDLRHLAATAAAGASPPPGGG